MSSKLRERARQTALDVIPGYDSGAVVACADAVVALVVERLEQLIAEVEGQGAEWPGWTANRLARRDALRDVLSELRLVSEGET